MVQYCLRDDAHQEDAGYVQAFLPGGPVRWIVGVESVVPVDDVRMPLGLFSLKEVLSIGRSEIVWRYMLGSSSFL